MVYVRELLVAHGACRRFENSNLSFVYAFVDGMHKFILNIIWIVGVREVSLFVLSHQNAYQDVNNCWDR